MAKPGIIVLSKDDDQEGFKWLSDGWYGAKKRDTKRAQELYHEVADCIAIGDDVPDVIRRLEEAGFKVTRFDDMP
jgi:hypothetical protein